MVHPECERSSTCHCCKFPLCWNQKCKENFTKTCHLSKLFSRYSLSFVCVWYYSMTTTYTYNIAGLQTICKLPKIFLNKLLGPTCIIIFHLETDSPLSVVTCNSSVLRSPTSVSNCSSLSIHHCISTYLKLFKSQNSILQCWFYVCLCMINLILCQMNNTHIVTI